MKTSGILLPIFSLPSDYGIGCFSKEAYKFVDFLEEAGQMCIRDRYESIGKNESKEITKLTYEQLCNSLKKGIYQVAFSIYRQGKDWKSLSMADQGFEKPAYLHLKGDKNYLELAAREMKAMTKGGAMLSGHIQTVKCRSSKDVLTDFPIQDKKIQIPFEDFEFEQLSETEITGQIQLFMTSSVGEKRMPESMATLILKI